MPLAPGRQQTLEIRCRVSLGSAFANGITEDLTNDEFHPVRSLKGDRFDQAKHLKHVRRLKFGNGSCSNGGEYILLKSAQNPVCVGLRPSGGESCVPFTGYDLKAVNPGSLA